MLKSRLVDILLHVTLHVNLCDIGDKLHLSIKETVDQYDLKAHKDIIRCCPECFYSL
jgi:hypothetical protein